MNHKINITTETDKTVENNSDKLSKFININSFISFKNLGFFVDKR